MTISAQPSTLLDLHDRYESFKISSIVSRRFTQEEFLTWVAPAVASGVISSEHVGTSGEGRPLALYRFGSGPIKILMWSQMHGDESTATMALADIFSFFRLEPDHEVVSLLRDRISLYVLPMLNPDGAARFQRRTSTKIDINRDALRLATPEARTLKSVRDRLRPEFGFNLHDQDPRYTVGTTGKMAAIALLAPPTDESRGFNDVRTRAKHVAASIASALSVYIPGAVAKWDDTFEPRAFGDNVQKWGTSTVLIESGGWPNDPEKMYLRKLNALALLWSCVVISNGSYASADPSDYEDLPFNMRLGFDLKVTNILIQAAGHGAPSRVDIGLNREESHNPETREVTTVWSVEDLGDLSTYTAYKTLDAGGRIIESETVALEKKLTAEELKSLISLK